MRSQHDTYYLFFFYLKTKTSSCYNINALMKGLHTLLLLCNIFQRRHIGLFLWIKIAWQYKALSLGSTIHSRSASKSPYWKLLEAPLFHCVSVVCHRHLVVVRRRGGAQQSIVKASSLIRISPSSSSLFWRDAPPAIDSILHGPQSFLAGWASSPHCPPEAVVNYRPIDSCRKYPRNTTSITCLPFFP